MEHILVHDLGTTGVKAALIDEKGRLVASSVESYDTTDAPDGTSEQNPADWLTAVSRASRMVIERAGIRPEDIAGVSFSGHMMGVVALDNAFRPLRPAILHSDIRSRPQVQEIGRRVPPEQVHQVAGNPLDVHYPLSKIGWLKENEPDIYTSARYLVQSKDYLTSWMTGAEPVTDYSDASLYGCFDFHRMGWSDDLCTAAGIALEKLPAIRRAGEQAGRVTTEAARNLGLLPGTPVYVGLGDGASAALGAGAWPEGSFYSYIGSTAWVSVTTSTPVIDPEGKLFTLALTPERFSAIGTVQCAGAAWDWGVTRLCEAHFETAEALAAASPAGSRGLIFLPYLSGERSPVWNDNARGVWFGLSASHGPGDLLRSILEGVGLALSSVLEEACRCYGRSPGSVRLIGGGARSRLWRQIISGAYAHPVNYTAHTSEATARGAFITCALGSGWIQSLAEAVRYEPAFETEAPDATVTAACEAMKPVFEDLYQNTLESFDDLARLRRKLAALEVPNAPV